MMTISRYKRKASRLFYYQKCLYDFGNGDFMFFLFSGIAKSYKTNLKPQKAGKFLELILFMFGMKSQYRT